MAEHFAKEFLARLVTTHIDVDCSRLQFKQVPTGHFNTTYMVDGAERPLILRIAPPDDAGFLFYERGMMAQEPEIHALVRERTSAPVAEILAYDNSRAHVDRDFILMERLPGTPLTQFPAGSRELQRILEQTGRYLREIHEITADKYGYLGAHKCMEPQPDWASAFRVMWNKMVDDIAVAGYYDYEEQSYVRSLLDSYYAVFDRPVRSRLLHMDIWSQNILVSHDANVTGILDFDRALWGDKEIEFAVLDYCGISEPAFWKGYGQERDYSNEARIRLVFYLAYEVQKYIVIRHWRNRDPSSAMRYKRQSLNLLSRLKLKPCPNSPRLLR
ncbi:MAG: aminoglycoside phosphotransferase family protein [Armatimonadetes bacterium]|nr:aminoglycoside phosphotransferase family protein [Armatimonadota bacterium]